jgi:hypothetical protein
LRMELELETDYSGGTVSEFLNIWYDEAEINLYMLVAFLRVGL